MFIKYTAFILLVLSIYACSPKISGAFPPKEYRYPEDNIENGKMFIYKDSSNNEEEESSFKNVVIEGQKYVTYKHSSGGFTLDSLFILNGKITEEYLFFPEDDGQNIIKFKTTKDVIIQDGSKLGKHIIKRIFQDNETSMQMDIEEKFLKDTYFTWEDKKLKCIVITLHSKIKIYKRGISVKTLVSQDGQLYYAEGLGLGMWSLTFTNNGGQVSHTTTYLESISNE